MPAMISPRPALVSRAPARPWEAPQYLKLSAEGPADWTLDLEAATAFESMRAATRAALRLPGSVRAFGLPLKSELLSRGDLH